MLELGVCRAVGRGNEHEVGEIKDKVEPRSMSWNPGG